MRPLITLTTDFGQGSPYVAQLKGAILTGCREVDLVDVSHAIGPQSIREGAVVLADATPRFPPATIHVAVVDPGVGTQRRLVYAEIGEQRYLTPDNGLLTLLARRTPPSRIVALENRRYWATEPSSTFHGRDILAPVAAHLARGVDPAELGPALDALVLLDFSQPARSPGGVVGEVLYVDSFGNLITNIRRDDLELLGDRARLSVECAGCTIAGLVGTYGNAAPGELVALIDSQGRLEVAIVGGSAARELAAGAGTAVRVRGNL
jgi:S-adenosylmethionine hydrolase